MPSNKLTRYERLIKVGKKTYKAKYNLECPICSAKDDWGEELRAKVDNMTLKTSIRDTARIFGFTEPILHTHIKSHSPYIAELRQDVLAVAERATELVGEVTWDADDLIQKIINIGGQKIQDGEMEVTERLLVTAIKEQGARKTGGAMAELLKNLDRKKFALEGTIVEEPANAET